MSLQSSSWWLRGNRGNRSNTYNVQKNTSIFQKVIALAALTALAAAPPRGAGHETFFSPGRRKGIF
jgi:hypothetical protein